MDDNTGPTSVELHCHIDGCVRLSSIAELARLQGIQLGGDVRSMAIAPEHGGRAAIVDSVAVGLSAGRDRLSVTTSLILSSLRPAAPGFTWQIVELAATHDAVADIDMARPEHGVPLLPARAGIPCREGHRSPGHGPRG